MTTENKLADGLGAKFDFKIATATRPFTLVDDAATRFGVTKHVPEKPTPSKAFSRAIAYLMRACAFGIQFLPGSKHEKWTEEFKTYHTVEGKRITTVNTRECSGGRNPVFSLKLTQVKQAKTDTSQTWRINIANRSKADENMGHVLSVTYNEGKLQFVQGVDTDAAAEFAQDIAEIVDAEFMRFLNNYDDTDVRHIIDAELADMKALRVMTNTNCFIAEIHVEHAKHLYDFLEAVDEEVSWYDLSPSEKTKKSLLKELQAVIYEQFDAYEANVDERLANTPATRNRGEAGKDRLYSNAIEKLDEIYAFYEYHADVLKVMSEDIVQRREQLEKKAQKFLMDDDMASFLSAIPQTEEVAAEPVSADVNDPFASV